MKELKVHPPRAITSEMWIEKWKQWLEAESPRPLQVLKPTSEGWLVFWRGVAECTYRPWNRSCYPSFIRNRSMSIWTE